MVHISILDYLDDSAYELLILSPSRITVVPQTRCSAQALMRLHAWVISEFPTHSGGIIVDYDEVYPTSRD